MLIPLPIFETTITCAKLILEYSLEKNESKLCVCVCTRTFKKLAFQLDLLKLMLVILRTSVAMLIFTETAVSARFTDFQVVVWIFSKKDKFKS